MIGVAVPRANGPMVRAGADMVALPWHAHRGNRRRLPDTADLPLAREQYSSPGVAPDFAAR